MSQGTIFGMKSYMNHMEREFSKTAHIAYKYSYFGCFTSPIFLSGVKYLFKRSSNTEESHIQPSLAFSNTASLISKYIWRRSNKDLPPVEECKERTVGKGGKRRRREEEGREEEGREEEGREEGGGEGRGGEGRGG